VCCLHLHAFVIKGVLQLQSYSYDLPDTRRYADLQSRFNAVKQEWMRSDTERQAMRHALTEARENVEKLSKQNQHLTELMRAARTEQRRLSQAKDAVMRALAMDDGLDLAIDNVTAGP